MPAESSVRGIRMITFPDGTKSGIKGLDMLMEELHRQGKPAVSDTISEMMEILEHDNYFAPAERHIYKFLLLEEYRKFLEQRAD
jgi:hypothetical protein